MGNLVEDDLSAVCIERVTHHRENRIVSDRLHQGSGLIEKVEVTLPAGLLLSREVLTGEFEGGAGKTVCGCIRCGKRRQSKRHDTQGVYHFVGIIADGPADELVARRRAATARVALKGERVAYLR